MVFDENLAYVEHQRRIHRTRALELPIDVTCLNSGHPNMLRRQQLNGSRFLATVSESASDSGERSSVGLVVAALQVTAQVRREGTQEVPHESRH